MTTLVLSIFNGSSSFLHTIRTTIKAWMSLNSVKNPSPLLELATLEHLKKLMDNVVTALASTFLSGSSLFFHLTRTLIKGWMSLKFCRIRPRTYELAALEYLEKSP